MDADKQPSQDEQVPVLEYAVPAARKRWWKMSLAEILMLIGIMVLVISVLLPTNGGSQERANRVKCAWHLRQIGQACLLYANDHGGRFPVSFDQLIASGVLSSEFLVCRSSADNRATGSTPEEVIANLAMPGHCSYVYVGSGLSTSSPTNAVVVYEKLTNHNKAGINVLFVDGHAEWVSLNSAPRVIAELDADFNPPPLLNQRPATQPATP